MFATSAAALHQVPQELCEEVHYYPRKQAWWHQFSLTPYIVKSRQDKALLENLNKDNNPILFEGLHATYYLRHPTLKNRLKIVRMHNIEHDYYRGLAKVEKNWFKKVYFQIEAAKLQRYERILNHAHRVLAISMNDAEYLSQRFEQVEYVTAFHPNESIQITQKAKPYALYHGNLAVAENQEAVKYLIEEVFNFIGIPLVVAGGGAPTWLQQLIDQTETVTLDHCSDKHHIKQLVQEAQVNILPTFQATGIKLKLLFALFNGKHCLVNTPMIENTGLEQHVHVADSPVEFQQMLKKLLQLPFDEKHMGKRKGIEATFSNEKMIRQLIQLIWNQ